VKRFGRLTWLLLAMPALASACATNLPRGFGSGETLHGMVYAADGRPLGGVAIVCHGAPIAESDSQGRFSLPSPAASLTILFSKPGYERVSAEVNPADRSQVLYARLRSAEDLLEESLDQHSQGAWTKARVLAEAALEADGNLATARFLLAALRYLAGEHQDALAALGALRAAGVTDPYCDLLEADIAEFGLRDWRRAAAALGRFLSAKEDPGAELRLAALVRRAQDPAGDDRTPMEANRDEP